MMGNWKTVVFCRQASFPKEILFSCLFCSCNTNDCIQTTVCNILACMNMKLKLLFRKSLVVYCTHQKKGYIRILFKVESSFVVCSPPFLCVVIMVVFYYKQNN